MQAEEDSFVRFVYSLDQVFIPKSCIRKSNGFIFHGFFTQANVIVRKREIRPNQGHVKLVAIVGNASWVKINAAYACIVTA